jgi:hypothetical protein
MNDMEPTYEEMSRMMLDISLNRASPLSGKFPRQFVKLRKEMAEIAADGGIIGGFDPE